MSVIARLRALQLAAESLAAQAAALIEDLSESASATAADAVSQATGGRALSRADVLDVQPAACNHENKIDASAMGVVRWHCPDCGLIYEKRAGE
jgi:hypothetical protein